MEPEQSSHIEQDKPKDPPNIERLSRRDFLKLGGLGLAGSVLRIKPLQSLENYGPQTQNESILLEKLAIPPGRLDLTFTPAGDESRLLRTLMETTNPTIILGDNISFSTLQTATGLNSRPVDPGSFEQQMQEYIEQGNTLVLRTGPNIIIPDDTAHWIVPDSISPEIEEVQTHMGRFINHSVYKALTLGALNKTAEIVSKSISRSTRQEGTELPESKPNINPSLAVLMAFVVDTFESAGKGKWTLQPDTLLEKETEEIQSNVDRLLRGLRGHKEVFLTTQSLKNEFLDTLMAYNTWLAISRTIDPSAETKDQMLVYTDPENSGVEQKFLLGPEQLQQQISNYADLMVQQTIPELFNSGLSASEVLPVISGIGAFFNELDIINPKNNPYDPHFESPQLILIHKLQELVKSDNSNLTVYQKSIVELAIINILKTRLYFLKYARFANKDIPHSIDTEVLRTIKTESLQLMPNSYAQVEFEINYASSELRETINPQIQLFNEYDQGLTLGTVELSTGEVCFLYRRFEGVNEDTIDTKTLIYVPSLDKDIIIGESRFKRAPQITQVESSSGAIELALDIRNEEIGITSAVYHNGGENLKAEFGQQDRVVVYTRVASEESGLRESNISRQILPHDIIIVNEKNIQR